GLFFLSSRRRHTRSKRDWSSDVCSSDLGQKAHGPVQAAHLAGAGVEGKCTGGNKVLGGKARPGQLLPVKSKFGFTVHVEQVVHEIGRASCRERVWVGGQEGAEPTVGEER